jgi:hypothetical protein
MKKKAVMIKHFYSADGALHVNEEVIVEAEKKDYYQVQSKMGKLYTIPKHIIKFIP